MPENEVDRAWNTRPIENALRAELATARARMDKMEKELIAAKRIIELAYDARFKIAGMLQALNNYEDAIR